VGPKVAQHFVDPARLDQPRIGDQQGTQRAQAHRGVRSLGHRVDAEHDLRRVKLQQPAGLGARGDALVFGYQRRHTRCSRRIPRSHRVQLRHNLASTATDRAAQM
jgi:hypothetical protein